jgi:hypothetical protein
MQKRILEEWFRATKYVSKGQRKELEEKTRLDDKQIKIWFQNRRMKVRGKVIEVPGPFFFIRHSTTRKKPILEGDIPLERETCPLQNGRYLNLIKSKL